MLAILLLVVFFAQAPWEDNEDTAVIVSTPIDDICIPAPDLKALENF